MPKLPTGTNILDLCCGTGQKTLDLSRRGYNVTGLDGSARMLRFARGNAPGLRFVLGDARSFRIETKFDAVVCMFDSLNHIMSTEELTSAFRSVHSVLADGGLFFSDLNTELEFLDHWKGICGIVEDEYLCVIRQAYDSDLKKGSFDGTLFRLQRRTWSRTDFVIEEKCYSVSETLHALDDAGFTNLGLYSHSVDRELRQLSADAWRVFFLCVKSGRASSK